MYLPQRQAGLQRETKDNWTRVADISKGIGMEYWMYA